MAIKNLVFDVGNVLVGYRWEQMLMDYGLTFEEATKLGHRVFDETIWDYGLDMGLLNVKDVISKLCALYPEQADVITWFLENSEQMAIPRPEIWEKIVKLKELGYSIYLLSNYSQELLEKHIAGASFLDVLDGAVISYQVHLAKPDPQIYQYFLKKYNLTAKQCIFFDDRIENVKAAKREGIHAVQIHSREMLNDILEKTIKEEIN